MITWAEWAQCYRAGRDAHQDGADSRACPYSAGSGDRDEQARAYYWLRGWVEAAVMGGTTRWSRSGPRGPGPEGLTSPLRAR